MDGFWQDGVVVESLANCLHYTNNTRYRSVVGAAHRPLHQLLLAYGPQPSFDDLNWYGLAFSRVAELTGEKRFLNTAQHIFDYVWAQAARPRLSTTYMFSQNHSFQYDRFFFETLYKTWIHKLLCLTVILALN